LDRLNPGGPPGSAREKTYTVIFGSHTPAGRAFDVGLMVVILASVAVVMVESVENVGQTHGSLLRALEWFFTIVFTVEYAARLWSVDVPRRYALSFFGLVDLLAVIPTYMSLLIPGGQVLAVVRILRVIRVFRVLKLAQYLGEAQVLAAALRASRYKITVFLISVVGIVVIVGAAMYLIEGPESGFTSIPRGFYWSVVTLTTVGYGDITPKSPFGQTLAAMVMIMGYGIIAVPTGIVTSELTRQSLSERRGPVGHTRGDCPVCGHEEPDPEADYCRYCGIELRERGASRTPDEDSA
jgi:voltage-gated potassium channel